MSDETLSGQIVRLRDAFNAAAAGDYAPPIQPPLFFKSGAALPPNAKLYASNLLTLWHLANSSDLSNKQVKQNLAFLKLTTFFGRAVCDNLSFWTTETNDDLEHSNFLFIRENSEIEAATRILSIRKTAEERPDLLARICSADRTLRTLVRDSDLRDKRRSLGKPCYSEEDRPSSLLPGASAELHFQALRQEQMKNALAHVETLLDLALVYLEKMRLVTQEILPLKPDNPEWGQHWSAAASTIGQSGGTILKHAEIILTYHAARHSAFPQRLAEAQRGLTVLRLH